MIKYTLRSNTGDLAEVSAETEAEARYAGIGPALVSVGA